LGLSQVANEFFNRETRIVFAVSFDQGVQIVSTRLFGLVVWVLLVASKCKNVEQFVGAHAVHRRVVRVDDCVTHGDLFLLEVQYLLVD